MQTGSMMNLLASKVTNPTPKEGDGCTILHWTDREAATIINVRHGGKTIWIQRDKAIRTDKNGMSDAQTYRYERDEEAPVEKYTLRKDGKYRRMGESQRTLPLLIGTRMAYYDYSF